MKAKEFDKNFEAGEDMMEDLFFQKLVGSIKSLNVECKHIVDRH